MFSYRSKSTRTLWEMPPKEKLYMRLTNITNTEIKEWVKNKRLPNYSFTSHMPEWQRGYLASMINSYLDDAYKDTDITSLQMALVVHGYIEKQDTSTPGFCKDLKNAIAPYIKGPKIAPLDIITQNKDLQEALDENNMGLS